MPVFASLTGYSQKGGGYDVGSAEGGERWPLTRLCMVTVVATRLQAPAHRLISGRSGVFFKKSMKLTSLDVDEILRICVRAKSNFWIIWFYIDNQRRKEIADLTFQKYNELWFEHDELSVRVTSLRLWVYEWGAEWIFVSSQALHAKFLWHDAGAAIIMRIFWHIHNEDGTKAQDLSASVNIRIKKDVSLNK